MCLLFDVEYSDWLSTNTFLFGIGESNVMFTWSYIIVLDIKGKHNFKLYTNSIPTNKEVNSYKLKLSKIGNGFTYFYNIHVTYFVFNAIESLL